ncbi:hypothetical protein KZO74_00600 [Prevotella salivae]|uniref:hypothetical protein n=1 Tax=Segatella salivae TaxID=228604 RepID=UPI001C5E6F23|nr:hypothetical protein [Segatella salivae]MBW4763536.1 hypothetical protein [Segatella salivae]
MKKLILKMFVVVLALAAFNTLMSCSSKDDEDSIGGTWGISSDAVMNGSNWGRARSYAGYEPEYFIYQFNENGTVDYITFTGIEKISAIKMGKDLQKVATGHYHLSKGKLYMRIGKQDYEGPYTLNKKELALEIKGNDGNLHRYVFKLLNDRY